MRTETATVSEIFSLDKIKELLRQSTKKKKKKRSNQLYPDQTPLYATSDQDVHGLGIHLSNLGPTNRVDQNKKEEEENGCVQAVHSFITLSKATFDLLDTPTAPGCFAVSVYSHVSHKRINYQTTVTDDSCKLLVYRTKVSEVLIF